MASEKDNASASPGAPEHQDQSIKARKKQLFEEPQAAPVGALKPFSEYVRGTPAAPMSQPVKVALWAVAVLTALLFLAAVLLPARHRRPRGGSDLRARPAATAAAGPLTARS